MAYISFKPSDYFNTKLYTGTGAATQAQTGVGFQPDFTWIKSRSNSEAHNLQDAVRGVTKWIESNTNAIEQTNANTLKSFDSDGFTVGLAGSVGASQTYASWNWKAGTTSGISGGTITPSAYSINTTSGFGIYKYTGTGSNGTIAHGLGSAPKMVICKRIAGDTGDWNSWHSGLTSGAYYINLNTTGAQVSNSAVWNSTVPSSTVVSLGTYAAVNASGSTYIAYVWAEKKGFSQFRSYTGSGNANGPFIYTGFRPQFFIAKERNSSDPWHMWTGNASTSGANNVNKSIQPNDVSPEATDNNKDVDFLANGVKIKTSNAEINGDGAPYIYMAWAAEPIVGSNKTPGLAR